MGKLYDGVLQTDGFYPGSCLLLPTLRVNRLYKASDWLGKTLLQSKDSVVCEFYARISK